MLLNDDIRPVPEAARTLGVSPGALYRRLKATPGKWPALASTQIRGAPCVSLQAAYDHFERHGRRRPEGLRRPPIAAAANLGGEISAATKDAQDRLARLMLQEPVTIDIHELLKLQVLAGVPADQLRTTATAANALQRKRADAVRAGKNFTPDEVVEMLRGYGELFIEEVDAGAVAFASAQLAWISREFGIVLAEKNTSALQLFENQTREAFGNAILAKLRKKVDNQVAGVRSLEFSL
jgi:hypothetical protein